MLVTLAKNETIAASSSSTFTYSPNSVQKVLVRLGDADWEDSRITVQIGSKVIANDISAYGLSGLTALSSNANQSVSGTDGFVSLDFGSHQCPANDNLYVTINASGEVTAVDVSALVDAPGENFPVKLTEYSDTTFTSNNNLFAMSFDSAKAIVENDDYNCEIRTSVSSSAPSFVSASSWYKDATLSSGERDRFGILNQHAVPLKTTYNYSASAVTDRIITVEQMGTTSKEQAMAKESARVALQAAGK